jgi:hypothetical protein
MIIEALRAILLEDATIAAAVGERIYPVSAPDAPTYPFIVLTKATGLGEYDMAGDARIEQSRIQVDLEGAQGASDLIALKTVVRRLLTGFKGGAEGHPCQIDAMFCINDFDLTVPATERAGPRVRRRTLEFTCWHKEI